MDEGSEPCDSCKAAKAAYDRKRREDPMITLKNRARAIAQGRALKELRHNHAEEYRDLYRFYWTEVREEHGLDG